MTPVRRLAVLMACLAGPAAHAGPHADSQLAAACASCHASRPEAAVMPVLTGRTAASIAQALRAYRSGARTGQIMQVVAASLSLEEIDGIAQAIAAQPASIGR